MLILFLKELVFRICIIGVRVFKFLIFINVFWFMEFLVYRLCRSLIYKLKVFEFYLDLGKVLEVLGIIRDDKERRLEIVFVVVSVCLLLFDFVKLVKSCNFDLNFVLFENLVLEMKLCSEWSVFIFVMDFLIFKFFKGIRL